MSAPDKAERPDTPDSLAEAGPAAVKSNCNGRQPVLATLLRTIRRCLHLTVYCDNHPAGRSPHAPIPEGLGRPCSHDVDTWAGTRRYHVAIRAPLGTHPSERLKPRKSMHASE